MIRVGFIVGLFLLWLPIGFVTYFFSEAEATRQADWFASLLREERMRMRKQMLAKHPEMGQDFFDGSQL
jgi:hypothetical protein